MKEYVSFIISALGGWFVGLYGGWDKALEILIYLMVFDYVSGVIAAFNNHELSSEIGFKGLLKKVFILIICAVAYKIDLLMNANKMLLSAAFIFYCCNEALSIIENAVKMGLPIPEKLRNALKALEEDEEDSL